MGWELHTCARVIRPPLPNPPRGGEGVERARGTAQDGPWHPNGWDNSSAPGAGCMRWMWTGQTCGCGLRLQRLLAQGQEAEQAKNGDSLAVLSYFDEHEH